MGVVDTCFAIADRVIADGDDEMLNAIHVSFLEDLDFRGPHGKRAFGKLTPALRKGWININEYNEALLKSSEAEWARKEPPK